MDYYSKYQKYKLKFLNLRKQIGGVIIWEYQLDNGSWQPYDPEESHFIEVNHGTFQLPINKFMINKDLGYQQGKANRRPIRRRDINENEMLRITNEFKVKKTIQILQSFPLILQLDPNLDSRIFDDRCAGFFMANDRAFRRITSEFPDAYAAQHGDLYREIIRSRTPLNIADMTIFFETLRATAEEERRLERIRVAPIIAREEAQRREWEGYPDAYDE